MWEIRIARGDKMIYEHAWTVGDAFQIAKQLFRWYGTKPHIRFTNNPWRVKC